jgi:hypothetical protein
MRKLFEELDFSKFKPMNRYNGTGYNLTNEKDGVILLYTPKENQFVSTKSQIRKIFNYENATQQWFNTLTGEFTPEEKLNLEGHGFWDWRPWRGEADAIRIIRNLEPKTE